MGARLGARLRRPPGSRRASAKRDMPAPTGSRDSQRREERESDAGSVYRARAAGAAARCSIAAAPGSPPVTSRLRPSQLRLPSADAPAAAAAVLSSLSRSSEGRRSRSPGPGSQRDPRSQPVAPARAQPFRPPVPLRQPLAVPRPLPPAGAANRAAAAGQLCPAAELGSPASFRAAALPVTVALVAGLPQIAGPCSLHPCRHLSVTPPFCSPPSLPSLLLFFSFLCSNNCYFCCRCRDCAGFFSLFSDLISFF